MFRSKSALQEERIRDLKAEHMRLVVALTDQIEYLRAQLAPPPSVPAPAWPETKLPAMSEEEEQLKALREFGHLDGIEFDAAMQTLAAHNGSSDTKHD